MLAAANSVYRNVTRPEFLAYSPHQVILQEAPDKNNIDRNFF